MNIVRNTVESFEENEFGNVKQNLDSLCDSLREENYRQSLTKADFECFNQILNKLSDREQTDDTVSVATKLFRVLRNSSVNCPSNQNNIVNCDLVANVLSILRKSLQLIHNETNNRNDFLQCVKCALQVCGNVATGEDCNFDRKRVVWKTLTYPTVNELLELGDSSVFALTSMVTYNCLTDTIIAEECYGTDFFRVLNSLLNNIADEDSPSEWSLLTVHTFLRQENVLSSVYYKLNQKSRLVLLDIMCEEMKKLNSLSSADNLISQSNIESLSKLLILNMTDVFKLTCNEQNVPIAANTFNPLEVIKLLTVVCEATSNQRFVNYFREKTLVEAIIDTLKSLHLLAENEPSDCTALFKCIPPLRKNDSMTDEEIELSPFYGFKRDLVRLIANLAFQCSQVQNWVREMEGIPVILDLCRLDARNPYITQWCIFAIRNLLENNCENQSIIASMERNGCLSDSSLLNELGFEIIDGKITSQRKK